MESAENMQKGATRPVTGPPLWRSPEASDLQDLVAEVRGGSFVDHRARTEAAVPATIRAMGIRMQNHKCNELENDFPIFKVSRLVRVHTDSHHNGHNNTYRCQTCFPVISVLLCMNSDVMTDVIRVMGIRMQNHKCNEVENAFPIFKVNRLVRVHTDSHHNGHNKMIFAVSDV